MTQEALSNCLSSSLEKSYRIFLSSERNRSSFFFFFFSSSWLLIAIIGQKKLLEMCKKTATMWCLLHCFLPVIFKLCRVMFGLLSWHDWGGGAAGMVSFLRV